MIHIDDHRLPIIIIKNIISDEVCGLMTEELIQQHVLLMNLDFRRSFERITDTLNDWLNSNNEIF
jgi:hypothetical protein